MRLPQLRRFLLGLIGPNADGELAPQLDSEDWQRLDTIAAQHRIQPHLHARIERGELALQLPADLKDRWQAAHRASALRALGQRKALLETADILETRHITPVALKGAWCAWHAYPAAAERPMRDIDVLLPSDRAIEAFDLLIDKGFRQERPSARTPRESLAYDKHLPPLVSPTGVRFELHMRLWERSEAIGWTMPEAEDAAIFQRASPASADDPLLYPAPQDMLTHFVIHAALSNRLNGGPLGLIDCDYLLATAKVDWPQMWQRAQDAGWDRALALVLHLVDRWRRPGLLKSLHCPITIDPRMLDDAPDLLLQDLDQTKTVGLLSSLRKSLRRGGLAGAAKQLTRRAKGNDRARVSEGAPIPSNHGKWAVERTFGTLRAALKPDTRRIAGRADRLGAWLTEEREP